MRIGLARGEMADIIDETKSGRRGWGRGGGCCVMKGVMKGGGLGKNNNNKLESSSVDNSQAGV